MRILLLIHRYLGIAIGAVMAMWCITGIVMMYVRFPEPNESARLQALESLRWDDCCAVEKIAAEIGVDVVDDFNIEMLDGKPIFRAVLATGERRLFDLKTGERIKSLTQAQALSVARRYATAHKMDGEPKYDGKVDHDQWTLQGAYNHDRPLHRILLGNTDGTVVYVSDVSGQLVLSTTRAERFWNWLGSIPHWLYPTVLREHPTLWSQVMIYVSLAGMFLTAMGLYIGVVQWRAMQGKRLSPYRGAHLWHHVGGLFFGVLTLTWVGSGFVSMSPWGLYAGTSLKAQRDQVRDTWIDGRQLIASVHALQTLRDISIVRIQSAPLNGQLFLSITDGESTRRIDSKTLREAPLQLNELQRAASAIANDADRSFDIDRLEDGDEFYYSGHEQRELPVYRLKLNNPDQTRFYFHALTGDLVFKADHDARWYRWLFEGLHRWDFTPALRARPWWDALVLLLMSGVTVVCVTGVYIGYRRLIPRKR